MMEKGDDDKRFGGVEWCRGGERCGGEVYPEAHRNGVR